ncbi:hypothetical protein HOF78_03800 [Candidatus Woesearchaeota archaeon]|jgi:UDP-N-acetylglucosamine 2-epimerase (non-hydrolysing)|nr:hypothetical protein [Candidatus Woesearchaeota archaeon]MBT6044732.1 hypothetical protein [Candidatus Woesearchaeota archaeon]
MILIVIGTRAELIKTFPVMLELDRKKIPYTFVHTGQHSLGDLCDKFSVKKPDVILTKEPKASTKFYTKVPRAIFWNGWVIFKLWKLLLRTKNLDYVLYHGDTMTTAAIAIASSRLLNPFKKYKNVHLEAGLRSGKLMEPFPEEISRKIADRFSDILLAVSERSRKNLEKERHGGKIITVGNTVVDSIDIACKLAVKAKIKPLSQGKFALISVHRHENIKNKDRLSKIVEILCSLKIPSYFTLHDNTKKQLIDFGLYDRLVKNKFVKLIDPLDYINFSYQMKHCEILVVDGGSIQEESLVFKKPCVLLREFTERQEGLTTGLNFLTKLDVEKSKTLIDEIITKGIKVKKFKNPYGGSGVSKEIVKWLK